MHCISAAGWWKEKQGHWNPADVSSEIARFKKCWDCKFKSEDARIKVAGYDLFV